jgi:hypothetical protein
MKQKSPIRTGATPPIGKAPTPYDLMRPSQRPKNLPLHGPLEVKYPSRFSSPGGKSTKPGPGMGSTITGSSRRPDEMDRSSMPNNGWRSDNYTSPAHLKGRPNVTPHASRENLVDPMGNRRGGRGPDQLKGRLAPSVGRISTKREDDLA